MAKQLLDSLKTKLTQAQAKNQLVWVNVYSSWGYECEAWKKSLEQNPRWLQLREEFVSLEWNRDWTPEVDQALQSFLQLRTGQSGWPMNLFLSPQGEVLFLCGSLEAEAFCDLTRQLWVAWQTQPDELLRRSHEELKAFRSQDPLAHSENSLKINFEQVESLLGQASLYRFLTPLEKSLNLENGFIGQGQIFHYPYAYRSLLCSPELARWGELALLNLAKSPLCDVVGGGFFRTLEIGEKGANPKVSTEKLLIDNAEMLDVYLDACQDKKTPFFEQVAHEILDSLMRDFMMSAGDKGAETFFASALTQSPDFYSFGTADLLKALSPIERQSAQMFWGVTQEPKILSIESDVSVLTEFVAMEPVDLRLSLVSSRNKLLALRSQRGDKIRKSPPERLSELTLLRVLTRVVFTFDHPEVSQVCDSLWSRYREEFQSSNKGENWSLLEKAAYMRVLASMTRLKMSHRNNEEAGQCFEELESIIFSLKDPLIKEGVWSLPFMGERLDLCDLGGVSGLSSLLMALLDYNSLSRMGLRAKYNLPVDVSHTLASCLEKARPLGLFASSLYWVLMRVQRTQLPVGNA